MTGKKPKKDEVITLEGIVNELTPTLIQVDTHNIAVLGDMVSRVRELEVSLGDTVKITYKNGILLTIDIVTKKPKEMHIDTVEQTAVESQSAVGVDLSPELDVHIQKCKFCGGQMRVVAGLGSGKYYLTQCISCKMIDTDPRVG